jgi:hypothetical protein
MPAVDEYSPSGRMAQLMQADGAVSVMTGGRRIQRKEVNDPQRDDLCFD